ncbi:hypothetical protein P4O66_001065 [Electrophorus voltai]|uniref:Echinoderm microtubule-associated protein-like 1 n=1 Tax=Electrophorus voltai TaxID=2609070 RepID=A0AAD9DU95_9TELE|nr:hypothetical protein P4O66_001065 [Electrophorus voltai]
MEEEMAVAAPDPSMGDPLEESRAVGPQGRGARLREHYRQDVLVAPEADFLVDHHSSAYSSMEVADRLTYLEQRVQMQEDEIQLLKLALEDVLKRLNISEEQSTVFTKRGPVPVARPLSLALSTRGASNTSLLLKKGSSSTQPSSMPSRNFSPSPASKRSPPGSVKSSPSDSGSRRLSATITTTSTSKKSQESSKPKEANVRVLGRQHVTHCKGSGRDAATLSLPELLMRAVE